MRDRDRGSAPPAPRGPRLRRDCLIYAMTVLCVSRDCLIHGGWRLLVDLQALELPKSGRGCLTYAMTVLYMGRDCLTYGAVAGGSSDSNGGSAAPAPGGPRVRAPPHQGAKLI